MAEKPTPGYFNVHKYREARETAVGAPTKYSSDTDILAGSPGHEMAVSFRHEPTGKSVFFKAFITSLNESFSSDWVEEVVYGRTDPIQLFKFTSRRISMGLKVPAESFGEAYDNLGRVALLTQFLYPNYTAHGKGYFPSQGPLMRLKVMNLIAKAGTQMGGGSGGGDGDYSTYRSTADASQGLLGVLTSLTINHNLESPDITTFAKDKNTVLPGLIELSVSFTAIHEKRLGWNEEKFNDESFPYGVIAMGAQAAEKAAHDLKVEIDASVASASAEELALLPDQARLAAVKRYSQTMGPFSNAANRLNADIAWIAKMDRISEVDWTQTQLENYNYLTSVIDQMREGLTSTTTFDAGMTNVTITQDPQEGPFGDMTELAYNMGMTYNTETEKFEMVD